MKKLIIIFLVATLLTNLFIWPKNNEQQNDVNEGVNMPAEIVVTFTGEVAFPDKYSFFEPITVEEAIKFAGGITANGDPTKIDPYQLITKSLTINIPLITTENNTTNYTTYNLNEISKEELVNLVGVIKGLTLTRAINIIIYRQENGSFNNIEDLLKVKEIGPATYAQISPYFKV